jgi:DNA-binding transcriptional regulator YiaG
MNEIKQARVDAGFTQRDLHERIGIPLRTIQGWEEGTRTPPEWLKKLVVAEIRRQKGS